MFTWFCMCSYMQSYGGRKYVFISLNVRIYLLNSWEGMGGLSASTLKLRLMMLNCGRPVDLCAKVIYLFFDTFVVCSQASRYRMSGFQQLYSLNVLRLHCNFNRVCCIILHFTFGYARFILLIVLPF